MWPAESGRPAVLWIAISYSNGSRRSGRQPRAGFCSRSAARCLPDFKKWSTQMGAPLIIKTGPFCGGTLRLPELDGVYDLACFLQRTYVPFLLIPRHLHIHLPRLYIEKNKVLDLSDQFFWTAVYIKDFIRFWRISSLHPTFLTKIPKYQHSYSVSWYFPPENDIIIII